MVPESRGEVQATVAGWMYGCGDLGSNTLWLARFPGFFVTLRRLPNPPFLAVLRKPGKTTSHRRPTAWCQLKGLLIVAAGSALLLAACATVEAPEEADAITLGMGTTDGSCGTTLCCSDCPAIPVLRVIDGDTFTTTGDQSVRLFGVDTPERGDQCYREATARLRELAGDEVRVELGPRSKDRYGRLLYYGFTEAGDSIDEILVSEGLAEAWTRDGQHRDLLVGLGQAWPGGVKC